MKGDRGELGPAEELQGSDDWAELTDRQFFIICALLLTCTIGALAVSLFLIWKG